MAVRYDGSTVTVYEITSRLDRWRSIFLTITIRQEVSMKRDE
jgi:hypothetical protein